MKTLFLVLLFPLASWSMEVLFTSQEPLSQEKVRLLIKNLPEELRELEITDLTQQKLQNPVSDEQKGKIQETVLAAQNEELSRNYGIAIKLNEDALGLLKKIPNIQGYQKITLSLLIKLAVLYEIKGDSEKSQIFWKKTYAWNPQAELNEENYSHKIIKKFNKIKPEATTTKIKVKAPASSYVFINGKKPFQKNENFEAEVYPGQHQIAVLIPGSLWQIENLNIKKPSSKPYVFNFSPHPILKGNSQTPILSHFKLPTNTRLLSYFNKENRFVVFDGSAWFDLKGNLIANITEKSLAPLTSISKTNWLQKLTKSPWFWLGIGTVAAVVIYPKVQETGVLTF